MLDHRSRARSKAGVGPWTEPLESRRLLVATPINVATGLVIATGLPLPGLATGVGLPAPSLSSPGLPTIATTVAPGSPTSVFVPSTTGPSTTLSPLMNDSETAVAAASETARPTPGRSDRISTLIDPVETIEIPRYRDSEAIAVIPGPELQPVPDLPAPPALPALRPPSEPIPTAPPLFRPVTPSGPAAYEVHDAAIDLIVAELDEEPSLTSPHQAEMSLALGALLAAWIGWKRENRSDRRSSSRPASPSAIEWAPAN